ncbi:serine/threonine-protein kinase-like protein [Ampelomyces quisqualis]|uniref:Serine/threonine-protein kinase-like protein n=1 Tax=Ampelomyces quisqualis TaxID=50730 RepID=A0A6A5QZ32_AMPQU|nr:serine/threonine-protein kinase-like protein [Ampelomyces quisqualis]
MAASPIALSPRPNPPGTRVVPNAAKTKALAILNSSNKAARSPTAAPAVSSANDGSLDLSEQMNDEVRQRFVSGKKLGEGTYANVYAGHYRDDPTALVAIKKIKFVAEFKDGIAMDAIREIKFLSELSHPNIIKLHAVFSTKDQNLSLVLEHLPLGDLEGMWKDRSVTYSGADIKAWSNMLIQAVWFCHENYVLHRDIKGNNLLIAADGTVKLADFGLARSFADPGRPMTSAVITRFYRPLELLYGCYHYGGAVDMWSVACVICELAVRNFFLAGMTDLGQVSEICNVFGTPTEEVWPGVSSLRYYVAPEQQPGQAKGSIAPRMGKPLSWWRSSFPLLGEDGIDLIRNIMVLDPSKRLTARQALEHRYWTSMPRPTRKENLPKQGGGEFKVGEDLKRKGGETPANGRADKVARKLDFGAMG